VPIDVDAYDLRSRLFGLFHYSDAETCELVGTMRITGQDETLTGRWVRREADDARVTLRTTALKLLPMLEYAPESEVIESLVRRLLESGRVVVEPGRLALDPKYRSSARRVSTHMIGAATAYAFVIYEISDAILACRSSHRLFYEPLGFGEAAGTRPGYWPAVDCDAVCLHGRVENVPRDQMAKLESIAVRLRERGDSCYCTNFPRCFPSEYTTGDFSEADILCPVRAAEILREAP
jgi:hypothetical protein